MDLALNPEDAVKVLTTPAIFDTISEDGTTDLPDSAGVLYLCGYVPELIGCFIAHKTNKVSASVHVQVLPEYRKQYAEEFGEAVMAWLWDNTEVMKVNAQIPVIYPNVKDFALRRGFEIEGINRRSFLKRGEIHDQWYLGIERPL